MESLFIVLVSKNKKRKTKTKICYIFADYKQVSVVSVT